MSRPWASRLSPPRQVSFLDHDGGDLFTARLRGMISLSRSLLEMPLFYDRTLGSNGEAHSKAEQAAEREAADDAE